MENYRDIRDGVTARCTKFPGEYWQKLDARSDYPDQFVAELTASGYLAALIPDEYGGSGLGVAAAGVILEEISRSGGHPGACHAQMYTMGSILRHGSPEQKARYLPEIANGTLRLQAFGVTEPTAGTDTTSIKTFARREGDKYIVNGQKIWISRAEHSDLLLLLARTTPKEQRQERIFLSSLLADFIDTRDRIQASLSDHDAFRQSAIQLIDVAEAHAAGIDSTTVETLLMVVFYSAKTLNLSNGSLDSLLASGGLAFISDDQLRAMLASWPSRVIDAAEDEVWILVDMQERAIPYLNSAVPTRNILAHHSTNADFITATSPSDYGVLWDDPVFNNLVLYRIYSETAVITENAALANEAEKIISLIESELALK